MAIRKRTRARELALQTLYSSDLQGNPEPLDMDSYLRAQSRDPAVLAFAEDLVTGCLAHRAEIDAEIERVAANWKLSRIAAVDRAILRIGIYEIRYRADIPAQVTLNEAIELAKRYSTKKSGAFVNGILDRIRADAGRAVEPRADAPVPAGAAAEPEGDSDEPPAGDAAED